MDMYVRVPIFPLTKYMTAKERGHTLAPMIPVSFAFADREVHVDEVLDCERGVARKAGGRGFRYLCNVSWSRVSLTVPQKKSAESPDRALFFCQIFH